MNFNSAFDEYTDVASQRHDLLNTGACQNSDDGEQEVRVVPSVGEPCEPTLFCLSGVFFIFQLGKRRRSGNRSQSR